jgi:hypothetical protein
VTKYAEESEAHWRQLLDTPAALKKSGLADLLVEGALTFARERPAYLALFGLSPRSAAARRPLRRTFAAALRRLNPRLTEERAYLSAQVLVELIKGLLAVARQTDAENRSAVTLEFKKLMRFYLRKVME